jgi:hypothetical protein
MHVWGAASPVIRMRCCESGFESGPVGRVVVPFTFLTVQEHAIGFVLGTEAGQPAHQNTFVHRRRGLFCCQHVLFCGDLRHA